MHILLKRPFRILAHRWGPFAMLSMALMSFTGAACTSGVSSTTQQCTSTQGCPAGQICRNEACIFLCSADADCGHNEICNGATSLCETCTNCRQVPEISSLNGTGTHDTTPGHASQHIANTILLTGNHFSGGQVQLTGGNYSDYVLAAAGTPTNTQMEVFLPSNLTPGTYQLRISNQAGADTAEATVLQGEQGIPGVYVAGDGIDVNGDTISVHYAGTNNAFGTATTPARSDHTHGTLYALQTDFSTLSDAHTTLATQVTANGTSDTALATRVTALESGQTTLQSTATALGSRTTTLEGQVNITSDPIVYLNMTNPSSYNVATCTGTTITDLSGNNSHFTHSGSPVCTNNGGNDKSINLTSSQTISGTVDLPPAAYTVELVMALSSYAYTNSPSGYCSIYASSVCNTGNRFHICLRGNDKRFDMDECSRSMSTLVGSTDYNFENGTKYHFVFMHETNGQFSIYINGVLLKRATPSSIGLYTGGSQTFTIGSFGTTNKVSMVRIYGHALTPAAVLANYLSSPAAP